MRTQSFNRSQAGRQATLLLFSTLTSWIVELAGTALDYAVLLVVSWWPLLFIAVLIAIAPRFPQRLVPAGGAIDRIAQRPAAAAALVAAVALLWSVSLAVVAGIPPPLIHDDYSILLGARMLAEGHAAFPTHPLWQHFEAFHVLHVPSYASKYPVGQQLVLAAGLVTSGVALAGSWLAAAASVVAMAWAVRGAVSAPWALAAGLAVSIHPVMLNWAESYRGGGLAALGGALLFGACLRFAGGADSRWLGVVAGSGGALLIVSRPFEGAVVALGCLVGVAVQRGVRSIAPLAGPAAISIAVVAVAACGVAFHNRAVTVSALTLPWVEYSRQYDPAPQFIGQRDRPMPRYRNEEFRAIYTTTYRRLYERVMTPAGLRRNAWAKLDFLRAMTAGDPENRREAILWPLFLLPLVVLPSVLRTTAAARFSLLVCLAYLLASFSQWVGLLTHYVAPAAAAALTLYAILMRRLAASPRGRWLLASMLLVYVVTCVDTWHWWTQRSGGAEASRLMLTRAAGEGSHLFLVPPGIDGMIANEPDIDAATVVWARDLEDNRALLEHFSGRSVWHVEKHGSEVRLVHAGLTAASKPLPASPPAAR